MNNWLTTYIQTQKAALDSIPIDKVQLIIELLRVAWREDRQIMVFANGGSAANSSHFATDLGKGASDKLGKRFRVLSLNDNVSWMTALANDYAYEDVFLRQLENYGSEGDVVITMSVSGNSPNCVKALEWAKKNGLVTVALVSGKKGILGEVADHVIAINDTHYGRVEDAHMTICHMICYAFMKKPSERGKNRPAHLGNQPCDDQWLALEKSAHARPEPSMPVLLCC